MPTSDMAAGGCGGGIGTESVCEHSQPYCRYRIARRESRHASKKENTPRVFSFLCYLDKIDAVSLFFSASIDLNILPRNIGCLIAGKEIDEVGIFHIGSGSSKER